MKKNKCDLCGAYDAKYLHDQQYICEYCIQEYEREWFYNELDNVQKMYCLNCKADDVPLYNKSGNYCWLCLQEKIVNDFKLNCLELKGDK